MAEKKQLDFLVKEGALTAEAVARLKGAWISNVDELYSRMLACTFEDKPESRAELKAMMEKEIGLQRGKFDSFMAYIKHYVSEELRNAEKPEKHPLGYRIMEDRK